MRALLFTVRLTHERGGFLQLPFLSGASLTHCLVPGEGKLQLLWSPVHKRTLQKLPPGDWTVCILEDGRATIVSNSACH